MRRITLMLAAFAASVSIGLAGTAYTVWSIHETNKILCYLLKNASGPLYRFQNGTLSLVARTYDPDPFSLFRCGNHLFGAYLTDGIGELTSSGRRRLVPGSANLGCAASYTNLIGTLILMR